MKAQEKIHEHPHFSPEKLGRGRTHVMGRLLEAGDTIEASDLYSSSNGFWEPCPCPGLTLGEGAAVVWVRPS